ncbi:Polyubiquitin [Oopsacas minuta]|uniref:Polyubiquitin n=1 Tax=Oopsacas minuta TaxID=111878 RepID=A0AAV7KB14_9METZ|nr:Polyubiquitin [Oopsacas minuta]
MAAKYSDLYFLIDNGNNLSLKIPQKTFAETKIQELKSQIQLKTGFELENQKLIYSNKILENNTNICVYDITTGSYILLLNQSDCLFVYITESVKTILLTFPKLSFANLTVVELKFEVKRREGIPENIQKLFYNGQILEDENTLEFYGIIPDSKLTLFPNQNECLFIKTFDKTITITVTNTIFSQTTVLELKSLINRKESIPKEQQRLILSGRELRNSKTLGYYKIKQEFVINLLIIPASISSHISYSLFIQMYTGRILTLEFPNKTFLKLSVLDLILQIERCENIPRNIQYLYFTGKQLEESKLLSQYSIIDGSTLDLKLNIYGVANDPFNFSEISFQELFEKVTQFAPHWRQVSEGVNFRATCRNKDCEACNRIVYVQRGFYEATNGECLLNNEMGVLECPMCGCKIDKANIHGVGIYKCILEVRKGGCVCCKVESRDMFQFAQCMQDLDLLHVMDILLVVKRL